MKNNNAIAAQGPDDEAKIEDVKPTTDEESPDKERGSRQRMRPYRRDIRPEDGKDLNLIFSLLMYVISCTSPSIKLP